MKLCEYTPDVRMIVDADHHLALAAPHEVGHPLVLFERKSDTVAGGLPLRRIHVMEGVHPVITLRALKPGEVFNKGHRQPLPCCRQVLLNPQQVDGRPGGRSAEGLARDLSAERMLQVEKTRRPLDVGQRLRSGHLLPFGDLPRT